MIASDWVLDWPFEWTRLFPMGVLAIEFVVLLRWMFQRAVAWADVYLAAFPLVALWAAADDVAGMTWNAAGVLGPRVQLWAASVIFFVTLARLTGAAIFYAGTAPVLLAPLGVAGWKSRFLIPHVRVWASAVCGFALLGLGMIVSIYRERWLRVLEPVETPPPEEA